MKKRWRRPLIYFVIVAGTAGFAFYQYKQSQKEKQAEEKKDLIFSSLDMSQVQSFSIKRRDESIYLLRQDGAWQMDSPVKDRADRDIVGNWLQSLISQKVQVIKEEGVNWAEYGLDKDVKTIEITTTSDEKLKLNIAYYSAFDGSFYIKKEGQLLLGDTSWATLADKDGGYFRSYKLLDAKDHPISLRYSSKLFKTHLKWEKYNWKWEGESIFPLSQVDLESYWTAITSVSFERETYPNTEPLRKKLKLQTPDVEMELNFKKDKSWSVKISPELDGQFYALISNRSYIFTLNKEQRENILLTERKLRDHRQPFQFKKELAHFMELKGYGMNIQLKKEKEKWNLLHASGEEIVDKKETSADKKNEEKEIVKGELGNKTVEGKLNKAEFQNIFNRINILSAKEYFGKEKSFVKTSYLILKDKEGNIILELDLSDPFESKGTKRKKSLCKKQYW